MGLELGYGYEYFYNISMKDTIVPACIEADILSSNDEGKVYIFAIRTRFNVLRRKPDDDEDMYGSEMMATEAFSISFPVSTDRRDFPELFNRHFFLMQYRLGEYLMPSDQILVLIHQVFDFTEQIIVSVDPSVPIVPIVVDVDVCTVQLDGETINEALERLVSPDSLTPLDLVAPTRKENKLCPRVRDFLLYDLKRVRVYKEYARMETCPICMCGPSRGALVSRLPCNHVFHSHCVIRWLMKRQSCPLCRHEIVLDKGGYISGL